MCVRSGLREKLRGTGPQHHREGCQEGPTKMTLTRLHDLALRMATPYVQQQSVQVAPCHHGASQRVWLPSASVV